MFKDKLREARESLNLSQKTLGDAIGRNHNQIYGLEKGTREPFKEEFEKLCNVLNRTPEFFYPDGVPELKPMPRTSRKPTNKFNPNPNRRYSRYESKKNTNFGGYKMSEEEKKALDEKVTVNGQIYDVNSDNTTYQSEPAIDNNEEYLEVRSNQTINNIEKTITTDSKGRRMSISIPVEDKSIVITIENF